jgi:tetratricopeptide (TPR) repeat protein
MRRIRDVFRAFIAGSGHTVLVVACEPENSPVLLKFLDGLEQDPTEPAIFLTLGQPFKGLAPFAAQVAATVQKQSKQVSAALVEEKQPPLAPIPEALQDATLPGEARLAAALRYVRGVVPPETPVVWLVYPLELAKPEEYLSMVRFFKRQLDEPDLAGTRLIVRDGVASPALAPHFQDDPKVHVYEPQLDPASLEKKLSAQANNPWLPVDERAEIHMLLSGMDIAHRRFDQALARNQELLGYFHERGQKHDEAMILNNIGDLHYLQERHAEAQEWYERAIVLAVELKAQQLVLCQSISLGNALFAQEKHEEALVYYEAAAQLGEAAGSPFYQIQALEQVGAVKRRLGRAEEAAEAWEKTAELSRQNSLDTGRRAVLEKLRQLYGELGKKDQLRECEQALAQSAVS